MKLVISNYRSTEGSGFGQGKHKSTLSQKVSGMVTARTNHRQSDVLFVTRRVFDESQGISVQVILVYVLILVSEKHHTKDHIFVILCFKFISSLIKIRYLFCFCQFVNAIIIVYF